MNCGCGGGGGEGKAGGRAGGGGGGRKVFNKPVPENIAVTRIALALRWDLVHVDQLALITYKSGGANIHKNARPPKQQTNSQAKITTFDFSAKTSSLEAITNKQAVILNDTMNMKNYFICMCFVDLSKSPSE